jgi:hypothetical protein
VAIAERLDGSSERERAVIVAMVAMRVVQVPIDQIVDVIAMRHRLVTTPGAVLVGGVMPSATVVRRACRGVRGGDVDPVLVDMVTVLVMEVAVVQVVDVTVMTDSGVAAARTVYVGVIGVGRVRAGGHGAFLGSSPVKPGDSMRVRIGARQCG